MGDQGAPVLPHAQLANPFLDAPPPPPAPLSFQGACWRRLLRTPTRRAADARGRAAEHNLPPLGGYQSSGAFGGSIGPNPTSGVRIRAGTHCGTLPACPRRG
jgi:hypothetical protein